MKHPALLVCLLWCCTSAALTAQLNISSQEHSIDTTQGGKPFFSYQLANAPLPRPDIDEVYRRGGYLHPIYSPGGLVVTGDYPTNHIHHHGVWMAWTKTEFQGRTPDFWNMGQKKGTVLASFQRLWSNDTGTGFNATHRHIDFTHPEKPAALEETWEVVALAQSTKDYRLIDLTSRQKCAGKDALILPKYHYGGLGFRGRDEWNGTNNTFFLTSEGITNRVKANESTGKWCYIGGMVEGKQTGLAILCHPKNFRFPQPMRVHPHEPFFCYAPSQGGDWSIQPGQEYISRYRFVVFDGKPDAKLLDRLWNEFASSPQI